MMVTMSELLGQEYNPALIDLTYASLKGVYDRGYQQAMQHMKYEVIALVKRLMREKELLIAYEQDPILNINNQYIDARTYNDLINECHGKIMLLIELFDLKKEDFKEE